jgi:hypothetical protein
MSNTINQTNKIDIDPQTMVEFMDRCMHVQRSQPQSVVGPRRKCYSCDSGRPELDIPCSCYFTTIHAKWKGVKVESKINTNR